MSRYVKHKHGLVLGSGNIFFVVDKVDVYSEEPPLELPEGVSDIRDDYRAVVSFSNYNFNPITPLNVSIQTPAQQLVWVKKKIKWEKSYTPKDGAEMTLPYERVCHLISPWWVEWLNKNVGPRYDKWDTYTRGSRTDQCLFFKRRKDALMFIRKVGEALSGIKIDD